MNEVLEFLQNSQIFFVATNDGEQPRVRPFGFVMEYDKRLYFCTGNQKPFYQQLQNNPKLEICACKDAEWVRIEGEASFDSRLEVKQKVFELDEGVAGIYGTPDNTNFEVFFLENAKATFYSFTSDCRTVSL